MQDERSLDIDYSGSPRKPVLSIILCSRNDQFMGNSLWRLETTLNYLALCASELGRVDDVEVMVTDWGSNNPLYKDLKLSPLAARMVSFVIVPQALAKKEQQDSPFSEVHALNAAARRVHGEYIGRIDQDTLVGKRFLCTFFDLYEKKQHLNFDLDKVVLFSNRRSIPYKFAVRCPALAHVQGFIDLFGRSLKVWNQNSRFPNVFWTSYVGIFLLQKDLWMECGGYNEKYIYYDWMETEMILRLTGKYQVIDLGALVDNEFYHLDHYAHDFSSRAGYHPRAKKGMSNPMVDIEKPPKELHPNQKDWGFNQHHLEVIPYSNIENKYAPQVMGHSHLRWLAFTALLLSIWFESIREGILRKSKPLRKYVARSISQAGQVWQIVRGHPFIEWPRLIVKAWSRRKQHRLRTKKL
jgi:hypothetical protein